MSEECETRMYNFVKIVSKTKADIVRKLNNVKLINQKYLESPIHRQLANL